MDAAVTAEAGSSSGLLEWKGNRKENIVPWAVQLSVFPEAAAFFEADGMWTYGSCATPTSASCPTFDSSGDPVIPEALDVR